jgi:hypothetical protein
MKMPDTIPPGLKPTFQKILEDVKARKADFKGSYKTPTC